MGTAQCDALVSRAGGLQGAAARRRRGHEGVAGGRDRQGIRCERAAAQRRCGVQARVLSRSLNESASLRHVETLGVRSARPRRGRRPRYARLSGREGRPPGQVFRSGAGRRRSGNRKGAHYGDGRQAARQSRDRELSRRGPAMKFSVVVFPGSNSDHDAFYAASHVIGEDAELVWHKDTDLKGADVVILPGGFAHGDYLRTGAIARFSPIMSAVKAFADRGGPVLGICNGFQVLLEAGLLPGAMVRNDRIKFVSRHVPVRVEQTDTPFTLACASKQVLILPIAHGEGNYYAPPAVLEQIETNRRSEERRVGKECRA